MKKSILLVAILIYSSLVNAANVSLDIISKKHTLSYSDFITLYNSGNEYYQKIALSNLNGVMDGVSMAAAKASLNKKVELFCIPDDAVISDKNAIELMNHYILSFSPSLRERRMGSNLSIIYIFALDLKYPCNN